MTLEEFRRNLEQGSPKERARLLGVLLREARPDDVFLFVQPRELREEWASIEPHLGRSRDYWRWLLDAWQELGVA